MSGSRTRGAHVVWLVAAIGVGTAGAEPATVRAVPGVTIDWNRGVMVATGAAAADLRAPSAPVARVGASRRAEAQARERLAAAARQLALAYAPDVTLGARVDADAALARRLAVALSRVKVTAKKHGSDGSTTVTASLPLESLRLAVLGTPPAPTPGERAVTALIVDARGLGIAPALGLAVSLAGEPYRGPVVFARSLRSARRDPRVGKRAVTARATALSAGGVVVAAESLTAAALRRDGALIVIVGAKTERASKRRD